MTEEEYLEFEDAATTLYTYPDVSVVCGRVERHPKSPTTIRNPVIVVEVLSPSTEAWDRGGKFEHYRKLPSLGEYVMVAQDRCQIDHYRLLETGKWELNPVAREDDTVHIEALGVDLRVADVYANIDLAMPAVAPVGVQAGGRGGRAMSAANR